MRIAYFDCFSGISGDMFLGAMVDAGLDLGDLESELRKLPLEGWELSASDVKRHSIAATKVDVDDNSGEHAHRHLSDIAKIVEESSLDDEIKRCAMRIFTSLADAEAAAHRVTREHIHFHEVGAIDSIVDIVGAATAIHLMGIQEVYASPIPAGRGFVKCAHGLMPLPAPGTMELLKDVPIEPSDIEKELVTPTGAAIISTLASGFGAIPRMTVNAIGYGAGGRDLEQQPNMLRVLVGTKNGDNAGGVADSITIVQTNIDDQSPEAFGYVLELLMKRGALDAYFTPIMMKKGRPAYQLSVLCRHDDAKALAALILEHTTTFGVRMWEASRNTLAREYHAVETPYGSVTVKVGMAGNVHKVAPEFEDCRRLAEEADAPIRDVYAAAVRSYEDSRA
ncbi:nickel pincer cofactor biosynthesis protein LarC [Candidatus Poribacteria bacterium]|jgi:pyridinium-3,5-bisthiocarboxylic acid mononucleotide nickel chelatase|nr:nickel pincer cofactor biosynthesis protein LarC [Candidatus Poribacteria bacterium]MBT5534449.1 nickel pincer cofactor biosynthesis protein LarC [Candidatus Poribacteria bacterium]MBT5710032.1 nickel pincer cofactor biosynthesis protein LarC [Candidatus Poribacteria bacterium]MBT7100302.1 nickel pincer cofactor biosynthesis protein LarC [Candidatus Poribacteria bacterium]MBT7808785.1 nickel pincer cofactor biosynthesis protein LarC [Candidatus Poribacteria bacterium]